MSFTPTSGFGAFDFNRLRSAPFEGAAIVKPPALPGDSYFCSTWLAAKEADLRDAREEESLSISRRALSISESARKWAIIAIIVSAVTAIIVAIFQVFGQKCLN